MKKFSVFPWLVLLFGVWGPASLFMIHGADMTVWEAVGGGGATALIAVYIAAMIIGQTNFDKMTIEELDCRDDDIN